MICESWRTNRGKLLTDYLLSARVSTLAIFCKLRFHLNICRYLKRFYTYNEINKSFLKFDYSLLRMIKIMEICKISLSWCRKRNFENIKQRAYK